MTPPSTQHASHPAARALLSPAMQFLRIGLLVVAVPAGAAWLVFVQDTATVLLRGGSPNAALLATTFAGLAGLAIALTAGPVTLALYGVATAARAGVKRLGGPALPPENVVALVEIGRAHV